MNKVDVGLYFWLLSLCVGSSCVAQWGGTVLAVKWISQSRAKDSPANASSSAFSLVVFAALNAFALAGLALIFLPGDFSLAAVIWFVSLTLQTLTAEIVRGNDDIKWASLLAGPIPQVMTALSFGLLWLAGRLEIYSAVWATSLSGLSTAGLGWLVLSRKMTRPDGLVSYVQYLREGSPIAVTIIVNFLFVQVDLWICGYFLGAENAAGYAMAQRFVAFISMPMAIAGSVLLPTLSALVTQREQEASHQLMQRATLFCSAAAGAGLLIVAVVGENGIAATLGSGYRESYNLFLILGAGQFLHALAGPNGYLLLVSGGERVVMWSNLTCAALLVGAGSLSAQSFGSIGLAVTAAACLVIQTLWMLIAVRRQRFLSENSAL